MITDYREAFVISIELAAHGDACRTCQVAAIKGTEFCPKFRHMKDYVTRAYEVLPDYYKTRYESAAQTIHEVTKSIVANY